MTVRRGRAGRDRGACSLLSELDVQEGHHGLGVLHHRSLLQVLDLLQNMHPPWRLHVRFGVCVLLTI